MKEQEAEDPIPIFIEVLKRYLRDRGRMVLTMAKTAGQKRLRMALRGLWRRYEAGSTTYYWFTDVVEAVKKCPRCLNELRRYGILGFEKEGEEEYVVVDVEKLWKLLEAVEEENG